MKFFGRASLFGACIFTSDTISVSMNRAPTDPLSKKVHFDDVRAQFLPGQLRGFLRYGSKEAGRLALTHRGDIAKGTPARERAREAKDEFEEVEKAKEKLMQAIRNKDEREVSRLLKIRDPNFWVSKYPQTPLHLAAWKGNVKIVDQLLEAGAKINETDGCGETPLHEATDCEVVRRLVNAGAEVNHRSNSRKTPLMCAAYQGRTEVARQLVDEGAVVNCADKKGDTPLHHAATKGHLQTADFLSRAGANKNALNEDRERPARVALYGGYLDVCTLLQ